MIDNGNYAQHREHVSRQARHIRDMHRNGKDMILSGSLDRFITSLARVMAYEIVTEFENDATVTINEESEWFASTNKRGMRFVSTETLQRLVMAHGVPWAVISHAGASAAVLFDNVYRDTVARLHGWESAV